MSMTKEEIETTWKKCVLDLSDENLMSIFNSSQQITEPDQMILKQVVTKIVLDEIVKRKIKISISK